MATIVTRAVKGSPLTHNEVDANFTNLNTNKAELASPTFTGIPAAPTATVGTNTTQVATTAFVLANAAPLASPAFTGQASFADGTAAAPSIAHTGDLNAGLFFPAADTVAVTTGGIERVRIDSAGQIGIGGANYGTSGQALISGGSGAAPAWGTLPLSSGGTGATTGAGAFANLMGYTSTVTNAGATNLTNTSTQYQLFTGTLVQTVRLPTTSTLTTGWTFQIVNNSTANLTVNATGSSFVCVVTPQTTARVTCISTSVSDNTAWEYGFTDFGTGTVGQVLTSGGSGYGPSWETISTAPTTAEVGTATAGLTAGDVGSYALLARATLTTTTIVEGTTLAGSSLRYSGVVAAALLNSPAGTPTTASTVVPPGTWKAMGSVLGTGNVWRLTLWLRIS